MREHATDTSTTAATGRAHIPPTLRIGVKNLQDGGIDDGDDRRLRRQLATAAAQDLHALGLTEAKWGPDSDRILHQVERALGMRGYRVRSNHHGCDLIWLIRPDAGIEVLEPLWDTAPPWWHGLNHLRCRIAGFGDPVHLLLTHLAPAAPTIRLCEAESLGLFRRRQTILVGDMNAVAVGERPSLGDIDGVHAEAKLDDRPARALEAAGFVDVGAYCQDPAPTVGHLGGPAYRCDRIHIRMDPGLIHQHNVVIEDGEPDSDHRLVVAELTRPLAVTT